MRGLRRALPRRCISTTWRAAAIDGSLTLKMTRAAVVDILALGAGGDRLLKRTYKECMKAAMLEVAGALQLDQSPNVNDAMSQLGAILNVSERPAEADIPIL